ncbi:RNase H domain protein [Dichotomopilus funicola]|uniref:ribonuclease H n=1 Tax=Dichotomopilus funicola TaxID=1934379 RepID=A0AAN6V9M4_9PEZI|nr:RNase H domain protein [Dichotomopilus funicola]
MPIGWYLAQGLIPLGPDSSDDEEGPCELPDGRLVCGPHGFVVCGKCCVDYSFMDEVLSRGSGDEDDGDEEEEEEEDDDDDNDDDKDDRNNISGYGVRAPFCLSEFDLTAFNLSGCDPSTFSQSAFDQSDFVMSTPGQGLRRGMGHVFPTKFVPPSTDITPDELFTGRRNHIQVTRFTLPNDPGTGLIRTDGACLNNGQPNPTAGWAFFHGMDASGRQLTAGHRLEKKGPFGDDAFQTSNRAELRAAIAALRFRHWPGEGFECLVIATDSEYVVEGATSWARKWFRNGWRTRAGPVKNKDLWEVLLGDVERFNGDYGMAVEFWRIPRECNTVADAAAKDAAALEETLEQWTEMMGLNC